MGKLHKLLSKLFGRVYQNKFFRRIYQNIEWPSIIGLSNFCMLGVVALYQGYSLYSFLALAALGLGVAILAAYNGFRQKSLALLDRYEERFFERMEKKRKNAALFLLGQNPAESGDLEDILDFFQAPIAQKTIDQHLEDREVYSYFYHWIRLYWQAAKDYVDHYREDEPEAWQDLETLYRIVTDCAERDIEEGIKEGTRGERKEEEIILSKEKIQRQLEQEAR